MITRDCGTWFGGAVALAGVLLGGADAHAEIPYADGVTPGALRGIAIQADSPWPASYWEYLPSNFDDVPEDYLYPMIMTLGGIGTMDTGSVCPDLTETCTVAQCQSAPSIDGLCRVYRRGPAVEIRAGVWDDQERPFIVIQPQNRAPTNSAEDYDRDELDDLVQFVVDNYPVDPRRLYILGNSQGGRATLQYLAAYNRRMAAGTIGPGGLISESDVGCLLEDTALWAFHGENDVDSNVAPGAFDPCFIARNVSRANEPALYSGGNPNCAARLARPFPVSRITMFQDTAHNAWTPAFENVTSGFGDPAWTEDEMCGFETNWVQYDDAEYSDGVYTWLLEHDRPSIEAGEAVVVPGDVDSFTLTATVVDDDATTVTWTQTGGPEVTLTAGKDGSAEVTNFEYDATYAFNAFVVDADNQWNEDDVSVTVESEVVEGGSTGGETGTGSSGTDDTGTTSTPGTTSGDGTTGESTGSSSGAGTSGGMDTTGGVSDSSTGLATSASAGSAVTGDTPTPGSTSDSTGTDTDSGGAASSSGCRVGDDPSFGWMLLLGIGFLRRSRGAAVSTAA